MSAKSKAAVAKLTSPKAHLRVLAGIEYASNPECPSIEQLHRDSRFSGVSLRTLERWASEDKWTERRRESVDKWSEFARAQLGTAIARKRIEDLELLERLREDAVAMLTPGEGEPSLQPKSWDAVVNMISKLTTQLDDLRSQIGGETLAAIGQPVLPTPDSEHPIYEKDAMERAARELLERRRQQIETPQDIPDSHLLTSGDERLDESDTTSEGDAT